MWQKTISVSIDAKTRSPEELSTTLSSKDRAVVVWYIGEAGITQDGASFYRDSIFGPSRTAHGSESPEFHLYDLAAWQALRNKNCSIDQTSKVASTVNKSDRAGYRAILSSDFFNYLKQVKNEEEVQHIHRILQNSDLHTPSLGRNPNNRTIGEVLPFESLAPIHTMDTAHAYSALQYLEGIYLVKNALHDLQKKKFLFYFQMMNVSIIFTQI